MYRYKVANFIVATVQRRVLMHNATGMDISVNQGRDEWHEDHIDKLIAVVKRCQDLSPYLYLQTLAKLLIDK
jgi:hypothetical protein